MSDSVRYKLARLREMLQLDRDCAEISEYFHTVLVPDDDFVAAGCRANHPPLLRAVESVMAAVAPGSPLSSPLVLCLESERMWHGYASCGRGHALFFYFEALDVGLCSFSRSLLSADIAFSRFTLADASRGSAAWSAAPRGCA